PRTGHCGSLRPNFPFRIVTGLDLRGALTFTPEAKRVEFDSDPGERRGLKETPHHTRPSLSAIRSAPKWPLQLAAASSFLPVRHRTHQRTEIERLSRSSPSLFSVLIFSDRRLSSTPLEILFFLNGWYYATYFLLELFIFLYKGLLLPYPTANLVLDVVMLLLYLGIEVIRLFFGTKGNLCQRKMPLGISVALTFPSAMMASYYLLLQTYVLRLEAIMNGILLVFCGSELLLEVLTLAAFSSVDRI
uniref:Transmembrane protein 216 n=2 Tax=Equus TaxID=9789 RepID=A0A9L0J3U3_EQUAS